MKHFWGCVLLVATLGACAGVEEEESRRRNEMERAGDIYNADGRPKNMMETAKPYVKTKTVDGHALTVLYKGGKIRREMLSLVQEDEKMDAEQLKDWVTKEKFDAKNFHDYIVWIPRSVKGKFQIYQKAGNKKVPPFYSEAVNGADTTFQSLFPMYTPTDSFPILVRFRKQSRVIPPLWVQLEKGPPVQLQWSAPTGSKRP